VLNRAAAEARQVLGEQHELTVRIALLRSQIDLIRGRAKDARAELDRILPALRSNPATKPLDLAVALGHRTMIAIAEGAYTEAERFAVEGASLSARLGADNDQAVAGPIMLALAYRYTKKFEQSRDVARTAYRAAVARFGEAPPHPRVIEAKTVYARALADTGELAAGIALIDGAVADIRAMTGADSFLLGVTLQNLVAYRIDLGELALADSNAAEALRIIGAQSQPESLTYAATLSARAQARLARRDATTALEEFNRAIPILERVLGPERDATLLARTGKALALAYLGRVDAAQQEIDVVAKAAGQGVAEPLGARVAQVRGTIARMHGDRRVALQLQQPVAENKSSGPKLQRERMRALAEIGLIRLDEGDLVQAGEALEQALKEFERLESRITPAHADALVGKGRIRFAQGRAAHALPSLEMADAFWRDFDPDNRWAGETALWLGRCYLAVGRTAEGNAALKRAQKLLSRSPIASDAELLRLARA
jgi:tetratricopeptide (TPR) repeat protein